MKIERRMVNERMSQIVIHGDTVYLAGQVAKNAAGANVAEQTRAVLSSIDGLLEQAGTSKSELLTATIWLAQMETFEEMNAVWDSWVAPGHPPARACVEGKLSSPLFTVEIMVTAALRPANTLA